MTAIKRKPKKTFKRSFKSKKMPAIKKMIKQAIARNVENKEINYDDGISALWPVTSGSFAANNVICLTPQTTFMTIPQGVGQGNRVGNVVRTKKAVFKYILYPAPYDVTTNPNPQPHEVQVFIFSLRPNVDTYANAQAIAAASFFQNGSSSQGIVSTILDLLNDVNQNQVILHHRFVHKLGFAVAGGTGTIAAYQSWANNDFKYNIVKKADITKIYTKNIEFNDTTTTTTSRGVYAIFDFAPASGLVPTTTTSPMFVEWQLDYQYEDA